MAEPIPERTQDDPSAPAKETTAQPSQRSDSDNSTFTEDELVKKTAAPPFPPYKPRVTPPAQFLPNPDNIVVLNQGQEGAAVGMAMATMIDYLLRERGLREQVSARMLQQLSKQYDGYPLDQDMGSTIQSGMRAWRERGVCPESLWPYQAGEYGELTPERLEAALPYKPGGIERLGNDVAAWRAAIFEHHAAVVGLTVRNSFMSDPVAKTGLVPMPKKDDGIVGGHAVAVLGYTPEGFLIQNSWGPGWGNVIVDGRTYPGMALVPNAYLESKDLASEGHVAWLPDSLGARQLLRRAGYVSDTLDDQDRLDIASDVEAVCSVLAARDVKPPLALGLFGNWGTGKSFFMARMHEEIEALSRLERENPGETPYCGEIVQIRFNAWHYLDANLWASLVSEIFERLFQAVSDPQKTPEQTRQSVIQQLGEARGLYRQSRLELEQAKQVRDQAQASLDEKAQQAETASLAELAVELGTLLGHDPQVKQSVDQLAQSLGLPQLGQSYAAVREQAGEAATAGGRLRQILRVIFNPHGRRDRLILLIGLLAGPTIIGALVSYFAIFLPGLLAQVSRVLNLGTGLLVSLAVLLIELLRGNHVIDALQTAVDQVETIRQERHATVVETDQTRLAQAAQAQQAAQTQVEKAQQQVDALEKELDELRPEHQVQAFIGERIGSEDYKKQLGLVSLVRRDFDKLSELMQASASMEAGWHERRRAALKAGQPFDEPLGRLLPLQRVILYIDDLDRCQPDRVIEVLEAVHLLLAFPLFVVVVAVDPRWLRQCLEIHYPHLLAMDTPRSTDEDSLREPSTPQDYLEKIFQIPFYLRPINDAGYRGLIDGLTATDVAAASTLPGAAAPPPAAVPGADGRPQPARDSGTPIVAPVAPANDGVTATPAATGAAKKPPPDKLNPEQLKFRDWELRDMQRLSPLFRTPRAVKRFVNTYRLVRVSIPAAQLAAFEGTAATPGRYRVAQVLLAIISGYPNAAPRFLRRLLEQSQAEKSATATWNRFLKECLDLAQTESQAPAEPATSASTKRAAGTAAGRAAKAPARKSGSRAARLRQERQLAFYWQEWVQLCETLQRLSAGDFVPDKLSDYSDLVPRVARFSFSVSMLPE